MDTHGAPTRTEETVAARFVPSRVVLFFSRPALSYACPILRCPFLVSSRVIPRLSRPTLSLSCPVPRCLFLVPSRVVSFLSRPALSLFCPVPRCLFLVPSPVSSSALRRKNFENRGFTLKTRQLFQSVHGFFAFVFEETRPGTSHDNLDGIVLEKLFTYWREQYFFSDSPHSPSPFLHSPQTFCSKIDGRPRSPKIRLFCSVTNTETTAKVVQESTYS